MTIPYSSALTSFKDAIYPIILWLEESGKASKTVYTDGEGYATIGAGFLMSKENLPEILDNMELGLTPSQIKEVTDKYFDENQANGKHDFGKGKAGAEAASKAINDALHEVSANTNFGYSNDTQVKETFGAMLKTYTDRIASFLAKAPVANRPADNREYLALLSLSYNGMLGGESPSLQKALIDGDRAEAWYQIRYGSNPDNLPGVAKRRYYESSLFGLYADPANPTGDEARQAYRTFTLHRDPIKTYELKHGFWTDAAGTSLGSLFYQPNPKVEGKNGLQLANDDYASILGYLPRGHAEFIVEALTPAKNKLIADLKAANPELANLNPDDYLATNIYLDPGRDHAVDPKTKLALAVKDGHVALLDARQYGGHGNEFASNAAPTP